MAALFEGQSLRLTQIEPNIVELCFDRAGESINKFDHRTIDELQRVTALIRALPLTKGVLVSSSKDSFIVGADIFEFTELFALPETELTAFNASQSAAFTAFEELPIPIVTAINGLALGGGMEMALASDYRILATTAQVGFPEVNLGIFPGFGGTARLPRLTGARIAIEWITTGRPQKAETALAAGAVDQLATSDTLRNEALHCLRQAIDGTLDWHAQRVRRAGAFAADDTAFQQARAKFTATSHHYPAALAAVDLLSNAASVDRHTALALENLAFARIAKTQAAVSLVQLFQNEQFLKKQARHYSKTARPIEAVTIHGAGDLGIHLASIGAQRGLTSCLQDDDTTILETARQIIEHTLAAQVAAGKLKAEKAETARMALLFSTDHTPLAHATLLLDAHSAASSAHVAQLEKQIPSDAILAVVTTPLHTTELASNLTRPTQFAGVHLLPSATNASVLEIVTTAQTSAETAATLASYAQTLGKTAVVIADNPGLLLPRLYHAYWQGLLGLISEGVDYQHVDTVMEQFGWAMGPAGLADQIGITTAASWTDSLTAAYGHHLTTQGPHVFSKLLNQQRLGRHAGIGFYSYAPKPENRIEKTADLQLMASLAATTAPAPHYSDDVIIERMMLPLIIEAARCLENGIVSSPIEVDMSLILGMGLPKYLGGALKYADWLGIPNVLMACSRHITAGSLYAPTPDMQTRATENRLYYSR